MPVWDDPDALDTPLPPLPDDPLDPVFPPPPRVPSVPGPAPLNPGTVATLFEEAADPLAEAAALGKSLPMSVPDPRRDFSIVGSLVTEIELSTPSLKV